MSQANLLDFDARQLADFCAGLGEKPFRAKQLLRWMHRYGEADFAKMSDIAKPLREKLQIAAAIAPPQLVAEHAAADGTRKWLLSVGAANAIETVFIPEAERGTLCVSSQVGCALECSFCATGRQGFNRNLSTAEIIGQLWWANRALGRGRAEHSGRMPVHVSQGKDVTVSDAAAGIPSAVRSPFGSPSGDAPGRHPTGERVISNVVLMGMGEPLANFDNLIAALALMLDDDAYGLSRRRVTVSTSGLVPAMDRLREACPVALAVSLHAPNDKLRDALVPINKKYPLDELMAACRRYLEAAPRDFITFEYVMLDGVNDSAAQARELLRLTRDVPCKFNLIPFNPFPASGYRRSRPETVQRFRDILMQAGRVATTRKTRGDEIDAACGQLAGQVQDKTRRVLRRAAGAAR